MDDRLPASLEAASIIRRAQANGDFATLVQRGDPDRGALLLIIRGREGHHSCLERMLAAGGTYRWQHTGPAESAAEAELADFLEKRKWFDEDSWIIELDVAQPERFIAETTAIG